MELFNFTHPEQIPTFGAKFDCASADYYTSLADLPRGSDYYHPNWVLFRFSVWLEAGSAWVHALEINEKAEDLLAQSLLLKQDVALVVGSSDPGYDHALASALQTFGWTIKIAEVF